jgi:YbbR domain-containing protein
MKNRQIHIIVATTLLAIGVWVSVGMSYQYQTSVNTPLVIENVPRGMAIKSPVPPSLQLRLRGDGWRLARLLMGSDLRVSLDVGSTLGAQRVVTLNDVAERLDIPPGIQLVDMKPESLYLSLDTYAEKKIPVVSDESVTFKDGYGQIGSVTITPESVTIGGAVTVLEQVHSWRIATGNLDNLRSPVDLMVPLASPVPYLVTLYPPKVRITIDVQPLAEKTFSGVTVEVSGSPAAREIIVIPPKIDIVVRGGIDVLSTMQLGDCRARVAYSAVASDTTGYLEPQVSLPPGIQLVRKTPDRVKYVLRKKLWQ